MSLYVLKGKCIGMNDVWVKIFQNKPIYYLFIFTDFTLD